MNRPLLCLCLTAPTLAENLAQVRRCRGLVDMVELRVDLLHPSQWAGVARFPLECPLPALCTIRRRRDGGNWPAPEPARRRLLQQAASAGYHYLDLEADLPAAAVALPRRGPRIIRSLHDLQGTPANLGTLLRGLARSAREIPKLAVTPLGVADLGRIVAAARAVPTPRIVLGMGDYGLPSRLLAARLGSWLTFASVSSAGLRRAAPGQLDPYAMQHRYRFHSLGADTPVFGIIGNPVAHSRSPEVHNRGLAAAGVAGVYVPFRVDVVTEFLHLAPSLGVRGLSVTIPHKETVMALLARTDPSVLGAGACNTLVWEQGGWTGYNTDIAGFLAPLQPALAAGRVRRATVVGAGGAARAIVWALRGAGVEVLVVNRNPQRAQRLASEMGAAAVALAARDLPAQVARHSDLIVQATSVGMHAAAADAAHDPIAAVPLGGHEIVYDIIYTPPNTPLIQRAREAGCQVVTGGQMLLGQAYEQFRLFTGMEYPASERRHMSAAFGAG